MVFPWNRRRHFSGFDNKGIRNCDRQVLKRCQINDCPRGSGAENQIGLAEEHCCRVLFAKEPFREFARKEKCRDAEGQEEGNDNEWQGVLAACRALQSLREDQGPENEDDFGADISGDDPDPDAEEVPAESAHGERFRFEEVTGAYHGLKVPHRVSHRQDCIWIAAYLWS